MKGYSYFSNLFNLEFTAKQVFCPKKPNFLIYNLFQKIGNPSILKNGILKTLNRWKNLNSILWS